MKFKLAAILTLLTLSPAVFAIPTMQIDIAGGTYFTGTDADGAAKDSIITSDNEFDLFIYTNPDGKKTGQRAITESDIFDAGSSIEFYLSVALTPKTDIAGNYGTFDINGQTIDVTGDMTLGTPPLDDLLKDAAPHGVYDTFYKEILVEFDTNNRNESCNYNVQDNAGIGPQAVTQSCKSTMFYEAFSIDKSNLVSDFQLHFDFYAVDPTASKKSQTLVDFAPWSHDAQTVNKVPVPAPLALISLGLLALGFSHRNKKP